MTQQPSYDQQYGNNPIYQQASAPPINELYEQPNTYTNSNSNPNYSQGNSYTYRPLPDGLTSSLSSGYYFCIISFILCLAITIKMIIYNKHKSKNEWNSFISLIIIWCIVGGTSVYFIYVLRATGDYNIASFISCMVLCISCIVSLKKTFNTAII